MATVYDTSGRPSSVVR